MKKLGLSEIVCIIFVFCATTAIASPAQILTTLYSFCPAGSPCADGAGPTPGLIQATDGNFYGTTYQGGTGNNCVSYGCGTVFKITAAGTLTTLYSFTGGNDGAQPYAGLIQASDGNFYGTTFEGGTNCNAGCGTVFKITPSGTLTTLHSFDSTDGANPEAGLIQAADGNFYGTTAARGGSGNCAYGCGTVFKITPGGTLTTLHSFSGADGATPLAGLVQATDGNFYGTTYAGGANGNGTVFKITPSGTLTTLHSFDFSDGSNPIAGLVQAADGNFYGTTVEGGASGNCYDGCGTVFKITPSGTLTTLHSFDSSDGSNPSAGLVQATDGNFYGTTLNGGAYDSGTVFKITPSGRLSTLHSFTGPDGGYYPYAGLVQATDGSFYGATEYGGANGYGTVFRLVSVRPCFSCSLQWK